MRMRVRSVGVLAVLIGGCTAPRPPLVVTDPDPSIKIPAMKKAVETDNRSAIPQMIRDLDSDDPAVRLFAIEALQRLVKTTFGYDYYLDRGQRKAALERWAQWQAAQEWKKASP
jgi:hypothetical protein